MRAGERSVRCSTWRYLLDSALCQYDIPLLLSTSRRLVFRHFFLRPSNCVLLNVCEEATGCCVVAVVTSLKATTWLSTGVQSVCLCSLLFQSPVCSSSLHIRLGGALCGLCTLLAIFDFARRCSGRRRRSCIIPRTQRPTTARQPALFCLSLRYRCPGLLFSLFSSLSLFSFCRNNCFCSDDRRISGQIIHSQFAVAALHGEQQCWTSTLLVIYLNLWIFSVAQVCFPIDLVTANEGCIARLSSDCPWSFFVAILLAGCSFN